MKASARLKPGATDRLWRTASLQWRTASAVRMARRHPEPVDGVPLEVELDQHHRLLADHPAVVPRFDRDNLRRLVLDDAAVGVLDVNLAAREEADVRVHAEIGADDRL